MITFYIEDPWFVIDEESNGEIYRVWGYPVGYTTMERCATRGPRSAPQYLPLNWIMV